MIKASEEFEEEEDYNKRTPKVLSNRSSDKDDEDQKENRPL